MRATHCRNTALEIPFVAATILTESPSTIQEDEKSRLVLKCEEQRKEIERLNRELNAEVTKSRAVTLSLSAH